MFPRYVLADATTASDDGSFSQRFLKCKPRPHAGTGGHSSIMTADTVIIYNERIEAEVRMKKLFWTLVIIIVVAAGSFVVGYMLEYPKRVEAENSLVEAKARLQDLETQLRMWILEDRLLAIRERVGEKNYGLARDLSSSFFEELRSESERTTREDYRAVLNELHARRDDITAKLTIADPVVASILHECLEKLRNALGRPRLTFTAATPEQKPPAAPSPVQNQSPGA